MTSVVDDPPEQIGEGEGDGPNIYGHDGEVVKVVLLLAGEEVVDKVLVDMGPPVTGIANPMFKYYEVVPVSKAPPGATVQRRFDANTNCRQAWTTCVNRYTSVPFKDDGWMLIALRPYSTAAIDDALKYIHDKLNPAALAVHYFGHGDAVYTIHGAFENAKTRPYIRLTGRTWTKENLPDASGGTSTYTVLEPDKTSAASSRYYVDSLATTLRTLFPSIPLTLVLDGCELAQSLDYRGGNLTVLVAVDRIYCGTNLALFSILHGGVVNPIDYDTPPRNLPKTVATVNTRLTRAKVPYVDTNGYSAWSKLAHGSTAPPQEASMTTWRYPWA